MLHVKMLHCNKLGSKSISFQAILSHFGKKNLGEKWKGTQILVLHILYFLLGGGVKPNVTNATFFLAAKTQLNKS